MGDRIEHQLAGLRQPVTQEPRGPLLETYVLHELDAHLDYGGTGGRSSRSRSARSGSW